MKGPIMVVDDDPEVLQTIQLLLRTWYPHATIHGFPDGGAALAAFERVRPRLVITDISMPLVSGRQLAGTANALGSNAVFVVVSGNPDPDLSELQKENPRVIGLLRKPFAPKDLRSLCDRADH